MGASNSIGILARAGIDADRGAEAVLVLPESLILVTDPDDELYCPDVMKDPSADLLVSMRNGWAENSVVAVVNRGGKGKPPVPVVADGRSRVKAALRVNEERAEEGIEPIKVAIVFVEKDAAYRMMLLANNRQKRSPLFEAYRWAQHKRIFARRIGKTSLNDSERADARKEFAELIKCSDAAVKGWEILLEAHPDVLRMCDARELSAAAVKDIVRSVPYAEQFSAAMRIIESAKKKDEPVEQRGDEPQVTHYVNDGCDPAHVIEGASVQAEPEKRARGVRSERTRRQEALGIAQPKARKIEDVRAFVGALKKTGNEAYDYAIAMALWIVNDKGAEDDAAFLDLASAAKKEGWTG